MHKGLITAIFLAFLGSGAFPAFAEPVVYATNENGAFGGAIGYGSNAAAEQKALEFCGGAANGCKIVMSENGDCIAAVESRSDKGYFYWIGYTTAENAYDRSGELSRVRGLVRRWCSENFDIPFNTCKIVHSDCASYIRNLN